MSQTTQALRLRLLKTSVPNAVLATIILVGTLLVIAIFGLLAYQVYFLERIHQGVFINGTDVSGMKSPEVETLVARQADEMLARPLTLVTEDGSFTLTAAELGAKVDIERTLNLAFSVGRQGSLARDIGTQLQAIVRPVKITPVIDFDSGPANRALLNIAGTLNRPAKDAQLWLDDGLQVQVTPAQTGRRVDVESTREAIKKAIILRGSTPIPIAVSISHPMVTNVEPARQTLQSLLSEPLTFTFNEQYWTLPQHTLADMVIIGEQKVDGQSGEITLQFNQAALAAYFYNLALETDRPPIDAWFDLNPETWTLTPLVQSQDGHTLNVSVAIEHVNSLLQSPEQHLLVLPVEVTPPAVSVATAQELGIVEPVSQNTSYFNGSSPERMQNIQVAASKFHGLVIPPGEVFSFNEHLGDVTAENGFVESLIIQGDRTAVGIGGGVCQVSTTAFRTAFFGGLEIVERWAHGYRVGWYETGSVPGLDATIYSPSVDLKFRNDTAHNLLIQTETDLEEGTVTFNFYGTSPNRIVDISEPVESNKTPHGPDIFQEDETLKVGEVKQIDWAKDGVDITIKRTVTEGSTVIHQDTVFSRYRPWQNVFKVGPRQPATEKPETD